MLLQATLVLSGAAYTASVVSFQDSLLFLLASKIDAGSMEIGQQVTVSKLQFGQGANEFFAGSGGDIYITTFDEGATSDTLHGIGDFGAMQNFVVQFSQEAAVMNDARQTTVKSIVSGFQFLLIRLR